MEFIVKQFNELSTEELYEIMRTRSEIFVAEQGIICQDLDGKDKKSLHVFCRDGDGRVAGYLRVFWKDFDESAGVAQIGRVVTLKHGMGIGGKLLHEGVKVARKRLGAKQIYLEAQEYAIGYYEKEGFRVVSDHFLEEGILHVKMELDLDGEA